MLVHLQVILMVVWTNALSLIRHTQTLKSARFADLDLMERKAIEEVCVGVVVIN